MSHPYTTVQIYIRQVQNSILNHIQIDPRGGILKINYNSREKKEEENNERFPSCFKKMSVNKWNFCWKIYEHMKDKDLLEESPKNIFHDLMISKITKKTI